MAPFNKPLPRSVALVSLGSVTRLCGGFNFFPVFAIFGSAVVHNAASSVSPSPSNSNSNFGALRAKLKFMRALHLSHTSRWQPPNPSVKSDGFAAAYLKR
jgi:hypothetical protein